MCCVKRKILCPPVLYLIKAHYAHKCALTSAGSHCVLMWGIGASRCTLASLRSVCTSMFDQRCSHPVRLCQTRWKWCSVCSLVFHLLRLCVFEKRQTQHQRNLTCPWQNALNPQWHPTSQITHTHTHSWHNIFGQLFSLILSFDTSTEDDYICWDIQLYPTLQVSPLFPRNIQPNFFYEFIAKI